jgi:hypothetical protein
MTLAIETLVATVEEAGSEKGIIMKKKFFFT